MKREGYRNTDKMGRSEFGEWVMWLCKMKFIGLVALKIETRIDEGILSAILQTYPHYRLSSIQGKSVPRYLFAIIKALKDNGDGKGLKTRQEAHEGIDLFKKNPYARLTTEGEKWVQDQIDSLFPPGPSESKESELTRAFADILAGKQVPLPVLIQLLEVITRAIIQAFKQALNNQ